MTRRWWRVLDLEEQLVGVAPPPVFARLVRTDEWMVVVGAPVCGGVAVRRVVATPDVAAGLAHPQMDPLATDAKAVFTSLARGFDVADGVEVRACVGCHAADRKHRDPMSRRGAGHGATVRWVVDRRAMGLFTMAVLVLPACTSTVQGEGRESTGAPATAVATTTIDPVATTVASTSTSTSASTSTSSSSTTSSTTSTSSTSTTSTTTTIPLDVYDPECVVKVLPDDTLIEIAARLADGTVDPETIKGENALGNNQINLGQLLDVCVDNGIDDITGEARGARNPVIVAREVMAQQTKLNELFAGYGIRELQVDGVSGPVTRQRLCAFRLAAGLPVSTADMVGGSDEAQALMAAT